VLFFEKGGGSWKGVSKTSYGGRGGAAQRGGSFYGGTAVKDSNSTSMGESPARFTYPNQVVTPKH
jgi:hypothetical protein